jgi:hypothetical protein
MPPFFILGCVRSGTTMLRNILRKHPNLACPEETQFFRWAEPFRGPMYRQYLIGNSTLKRHRQIDGISEPEFLDMLNSSNSRGDLCSRYMARYLALAKPSAGRWFDKSPQNAYGAAMIAADFPAAKFIHIVRDPVNVVASLRIGKVMKLEDMVAACSYWNEAAANLALLKRGCRNRVLEISYERFTADPMAGIQEVLNFVGEPYEASVFAGVVTSEVDHASSGVLSAEELQQVRELCLEGRVRYGYAAPTALVDRKAEKQKEREALRLQRQESALAARAVRSARRSAASKPDGDLKP